jgi:hypothetical protein
MKSSISKFNRGEHSMSTKKKEHYGIKQADKDKESQEIPRHPSNYVVNITRTCGYSRRPVAGRTPVGLAGARGLDAGSRGAGYGGDVGRANRYAGD